MVELDLIAPPKVIQTSVSLEPAHNVVNSLQMLNLIHETSGFTAWVYQTERALPQNLRQDNRMFFLAFFAADYLEGRSWPSFPAWVDDLAARDPQDLLQTQRCNLDHFLPTLDWP